MARIPEDHARRGGLPAARREASRGAGSGLPRSGPVIPLFAESARRSDSRRHHPRQDEPRPPGAALPGCGRAGRLEVPGRSRPATDHRDRAPDENATSLRAGALLLSGGRGAHEGEYALDLSGERLRLTSQLPWRRMRASGCTDPFSWSPTGSLACPRGSSAETLGGTPAVATRWACSPTRSVRGTSRSSGKGWRDSSRTPDVRGAAPPWECASGKPQGAFLTFLRRAASVDAASCHRNNRAPKPSFVGCSRVLPLTIHLVVPNAGG